METLVQDFRYALRTLRRSPSFTAAAVACLALGIGANTAIFSVIDGVLLRPLPFSDPESLVMLWERDARRGAARNTVSPGNFRDWRDRSASFTALAAYFDGRANLTGIDEPVEVPRTLATASFFDVLGVRPEVGRSFTPEEDRPDGPRVAVISHRLWQQRFGGRAGLAGTSITLDGTPFTVVGVMPEGFRMEGSRTDVWTPLRLHSTRDYRALTGRFLSVVARLKPGVSNERARSEMNAIARRLEAEYPSFNAGWGATVVPLTEQVVGPVRRALFVLGGVVAFVLLIACANVASLLLSRATSRSREIAVRTALGAPRGRVVQQLLTESVVLAGLGAVLGLVLAFWGVTALTALAPHAVPRLATVRIDGWTIAFTLIVTGLTGLVFGLGPAVYAARTDLQGMLRQGGRGSAAPGGARRMLVAAQVALSLVLLAGAGLMLRSFATLRAIDPGFDPEHVLTFRLQPAGDRYRDGLAGTALFEQVIERVARLPGVQAAGAIEWLPFGGAGSANDYWIDGRPIPPSTESHVADIRTVHPDYFRAMHIRVLRGTPFDARANSAKPMQVVVNEALVRKHFADSNPIGQHVMIPWGDTLRGEIVGVVADTRDAGLDSTAQPAIYGAMRQWAPHSMTVVIRTAGDPMLLVPAVTREVRALEPNVPLADLKPLADYLDASLVQRRFSMTLLAIFAAVALALAAIGIYGVLAYSVAQRTREIGVRIALGARDVTVAGMVVREALVVVGVGLAIGLAGALALTRLLGNLLFEVGPNDPVTFAGVTAALGTVALAASYLPARRAARVDPILALRSD